MLKTRIITALILAPLAIGGIFFLGPLGFALFTGAIILLGAWEWANLAGLVPQWQRVTYALVIGAILYLCYQPSTVVLWLALLWWLICFFLVRSYPGTSGLWQPVAVRAVMGALVLVPAWIGLNVLRNGSPAFGDIDTGLWLIVYVFATVWVADVGAYFSGRAFGKTKLAPRVSPGKSWAGVWGGLIAVAVLAILAGQWANAGLVEASLLVVVSVAVGLVSVLGDLLESMMKRFRGVKDSSQLLPGHGGILDRIDSLTAALPVFTLLAILLGWLVAGG
ncbi:phosphatidate cytidylyltransferase [Marinobacter sp. X15-166B]|uniref:phosphatidate cytidylyltransferase n=1 Tax=Marinobacter sp. X15-166B TaxID=1897620 RepID=UPI00085BC944|nr:phosphatidate cytidylyltransferase [Marinobacter sp. X15-166B]OEY67030.1 phosphatidate cytidylyltransferase [Marinobacter sp. X15-166B]